MAKRTKAEQKRMDEIEALRSRLEDIYSGATGRAWNNEDEWPGADELSRIVPAVRDVFALNDEIEGRHKALLVNPCQLGRFDCTMDLAEFLHVHGIRA